MAIEHSCQTCGRALGRVRAPLDPVYHLPVVVCPGCGAACVRRPAHQRLGRHVGRWCAAVKGLVGRAVLSFVLVAVFLSGMAALSGSLHEKKIDLRQMVNGLCGERSPGYDAWRDDYGAIALVLALGGGMAAGTAATAGLAHLRRWAPWALFGGAALGILGLGFGMEIVDRLAYSGVAGARGAWSGAGRDIEMMAQAAPVGLLGAALGVPIGRVLRRALARREKKRWLKGLARARKRRMAL